MFASNVVSSAKVSSMAWSLPSNCWVNLVSQNVLSSDGTLSLTHSVSMKVFRPKFAMNCRFAETVCITDLEKSALRSGHLNFKS